jgi:methionyl-tRNA formyltransferase
VTLHYMEAKADQGDIVAYKSVPITFEDTALTLFAKMTVTAQGLMQETYPLLRAGTAPRLTQNHARASYYGGRTPADGLIDWRHAALQVYNLVRAVTHPYPGAFTLCQSRKLFIWGGQVTAAPVMAPAAPGLITAAVPQEGLLVATGAGHFLITQAQWENEPEFLGPVLATWNYLVGQRFEM